MCGIAGFVERDGGAGPSAGQRAALLQGMCDVIRHRGPDDEGFYVQDGVALGMRRLSIIDVSTGHQPITNEDGTVWVVFNGEIYNYRELRSALERLGHRFRTATDTEIIVHAYEEWGDRAFTHLRGMFAIAMWDTRARRLLLVRDRVGIKPLFYAQSARRFVFGSEIKSILAAARSRRSWRRRPSTTTCRSSTRRGRVDLQGHPEAAARAPAVVVARSLRGPALLDAAHRRDLQGLRRGRGPDAALGAGRRGVVAHGQRRADRRVPLRRHRFGRRRRADGRGLHAAGQDLLDRLRRAGVRRTGGRAAHGAALRDRPPRVRGAARCPLDPRSADRSLRRTVRRPLRHSRPGTSASSPPRTSRWCCRATAATSCSAATIATSRTLASRRSTAGPARSAVISRARRGG